MIMEGNHLEIEDIPVDGPPIEVGAAVLRPEASEIIREFSPLEIATTGKLQLQLVSRCFEPFVLLSTESRDTL
jgi:hypothetical protein